MRILRIPAVATIAILGLLTVACASETVTYGHGSRSTLYGTLEELAGDSSAVVTGTAQQQTVHRDAEGSTFTLTTFAIEERINGSAIGEAIEPGPTTIDVGTSIVVRQLGDPSMRGLPAPILQVESRYLLFITPSMLPGEASRQFYITGGSAGYYRSAAGSSTPLHDAFEKVGDEGDSLPITLNVAELQAELE